MTLEKTCVLVFCSNFAARNIKQIDCMRQILMIMAAMLLTCCSSESDMKAQETQTTANGKKVLVAYFSFTGNTKAYAEKIAEMTDGDLYEIVPEVAYGSENNSYYDETTRAYKEQYNTGGEQRPAIKATLENAAQYDVVFLGSPIWYGKSPRVILTFLDTYGFKGKTIIPFVTSQASGITKVNEELPATYPDINWNEGRRLNGTSDADLRTWVESFFGTMGISTTANASRTRTNNIYSIDGRMFSKSEHQAHLSKGIYIIEGKKIIK